MKSLRQQIEQRVRAGFSALDLNPDFGQVEISHRPDLSDFQCNGAMMAARVAGKPPRGIAEQVAGKLQGDEAIARVSVDGPGFLNIIVSDRVIISTLAATINDSRLGCPLAFDRGMVLIDFGGPNIAKAMHVGHLRSAIIGDCLQRLFRFVGNQVISDVHLGDWGLPMGMLIAELFDRHPELRDDQQAQNNFTITLQQLNELYPQASERCKGNIEALNAARRATVALQEGEPSHKMLWEKFVAVSIDGLKADFARLGVTFDLWNGESTVNSRLRQLIPVLQDQNHAIESDGAIILPVPSNGEPMPPIILVNSEGGVTYGSTDVATIAERSQIPGLAKILYVVDQRQSLHLKQLFLVAKQIGIDNGVTLEHIGFGTINASDGKPFRTRAGTAMPLGTLIDMVIAEESERLAESDIAGELTDEQRSQIARKVGIAALKFVDLSKHRLSDYIFDVERFTGFEGKTGPYILYGAVRMRSLLSKAERENKLPGTVDRLNTPIERNLCLKLLALPEVIEESYIHRAPSILCEFAYTLTQEFSVFYQKCHILSDPDGDIRASRLRLVALTLAELEIICALLGMELPERM